MDPIRARMLTYGYVLYGTGGGCEAFRRDDGDCYRLLTVFDDPSVPETLDDLVIVGAYRTADDDAEPFAVTDVLPLRDLLANGMLTSDVSQWGAR